MSLSKQTHAHKIRSALYATVRPGEEERFSALSKAIDELYQDQEPAPTAAEDGLREALEAKIASLEASIKGKEAIIYGLLTKGTNQ